MTTVVLLVCAVAVAGAATVSLCRRFPELRSLVPWLVTVLVSAVVVVALLDRPFGSGTDELVYQRQAESVWLSVLLTGGLDADYVVVDAGKSGWPTMLGIVYRVTGHDSPYLGIALNAIVAYVALLLSAAAGCRLWGARRWSWWAGPMVTLSPPVLIFSASLLRETWVWLSVTIAVHALISLTDRRWLHGAALLGVSLALAYWVRAPMAAIVMGAIVAGLIVGWVWRRTGTVGALVVLAAMTLVGQRVVVYALAYLGYTPASLLATRDYLAVSSTTGFPPADPFTIPGLVEAMVRVGLGPFPWELRPAFVWAWVLANWIFWILLIVVAARGVARHGPSMARIALMTFCLVLLVGLALSLTNYGIVVRMRAVVMIAVIPLAWGALRPVVIARAASERIVR